MKTGIMFISCAVIWALVFLVVFKPQVAEHLSVVLGIVVLGTVTLYFGIFVPMFGF